MREIKFRGKDIKTGKWVYGNLVELDLTYIYPKTLRTGFEKQFQDEYTDRMVYRHEVDPNTIGQNVYWKDKNGVEIYVGDIIEVNYRNPENGVSGSYQAEIISNEYQLGFLFKELDDDRATPYSLELLLDDNDETFLEIVGNIHDKVGD